MSIHLAQVEPSRGRARASRDHRSRVSPKRAKADSARSIPPSASKKDRQMGRRRLYRMAKSKDGSVSGS